MMRDKTLILEDQKQKNGYTCIPNVVMVARGLSIGAKIIYGLLLMFAWQDNECFPGQERLAAAASISVRQVQRYLVELKEFGLITWRCRGQNQTNIYYIRDVKKVERLKIPDTTNMSCPDATPMSYKEDSDQNVVVDQLAASGNKYATHDLDDEFPNIGEFPNVSDSSENDKPDSGGKFDSAGEFEESLGVSDNNMTELQQQAQKVCGVQIPMELLDSLVAEFGEQKVKEKIKMLGSVQTRNASGFLVAALRDNYVLRPGRPKQQQNNRASPDGRTRGKSNRTRGPNTDDESRSRKKELIRTMYRS